MSSSEDACQSCGACCAYSYDWPEFTDESDRHLSRIPIELCNCDTGRMKCVGDRCCALQGEVGKSVSCSIYKNRPNVCRQFKPGTAGCEMVRRSFGLPALVQENPPRA